MYCMKGGFTIPLHYIGCRLICGRAAQAGRSVIDQREGTKAGASGGDLGAPFSFAEGALTHHPQAGGEAACGSHVLSWGGSAGYR